MDNANGSKKTRGFRWIKLDTRRWLGASTRDEISPGERATWIDLLCMAGENEPPGQIDFTSIRRLANQINISPKLLTNTLIVAIENKKIKIVRFRVVPDTQEKTIDKEINFDQIANIMRRSETNRSKTGITLYAILISNWNHYQSEYLRQKTYRREAKRRGKHLSKNGQYSVTQVTSRKEKSREEENRKENKIEEENRKDNIRGDNLIKNQFSPRGKEADDNWIESDIARLPENPMFSNNKLSAVARRILEVFGSSISHGDTILLAYRICCEEMEKPQFTFNDFLQQTDDYILKDPKKLFRNIIGWLDG